MKRCPDCGEFKAPEDFPRNKNKRDGRHTYCTPCHRIRCRATLAKAGGARYYHLRRRYGITPEEFDAMYAAQAGVCAICKENPASHLDHDHAGSADKHRDGEVVRGILCVACNNGLGNFRDRAELLAQAARYLEGGQ